MTEEDEVTRAVSRKIGAASVQISRLEVRLRRTAKIANRCREREQKLQARLQKLEAPRGAGPAPADGETVLLLHAGVLPAGDMVTFRVVRALSKIAAARGSSNAMIDSHARIALEALADLGATKGSMPDVKPSPAPSTVGVIEFVPPQDVT